MNGDYVLYLNCKDYLSPVIAKYDKLFLWHSLLGRNYTVCVHHLSKLNKEHVNQPITIQFCQLSLQ